jgi:hypothetical protein
VARSAWRRAHPRIPVRPELQERELDRPELRGNVARSRRAVSTSTSPSTAPTDTHVDGWIGYTRKVYRTSTGAYSSTCTSVGEKDHLPSAVRAGWQPGPRPHPGGHGLDPRELVRLLSPLFPGRATALGSQRFKSGGESRRTFLCPYAEPSSPAGAWILGPRLPPCAGETSDVMPSGPLAMEGPGDARVSGSTRDKPGRAPLKAISDRPPVGRRARPGALRQGALGGDRGASTRAAGGDGVRGRHSRGPAHGDSEGRIGVRIAEKARGRRLAVVAQPA